MKRLTTSKQWDDCKVFYMGRHVGNIKQLKDPKYNMLYFQFESLDGSYKADHYIFTWLHNHLRGYYDRLTVKQALGERND